MTVGAIIVAAGSSQRMGGTDKLLLSLSGRPLIWHSLRAFASHSEIDAIVLVASESNHDELARIVYEAAPQATVVMGGARRRDSVMAGIEALTDSDYLIVHDGARPLVSPSLIERALKAAQLTGASLCAVPVSDTIKRGDEAGMVKGTISREGLWLAQTPQAFRRDLLLKAHKSTDADATDDASMVEWINEAVELVLGSNFNIKITVLEDIKLAEAMLEAHGEAS